MIYYLIASVSNLFDIKVVESIKIYVEQRRPAMYRAMKYWGKKPHNIWSDIIEENTEPGDIIYDPFAGSAVTFFESIKLDRKPIVNDINPLTSFIIDVFSDNYEREIIDKHFNIIEKRVRKTKNYSKNFVNACIKCDNFTDVYNYRYYQSKTNDPYYKIAYKCNFCKNTILQDSALDLFNEEIAEWTPSYPLSNLHSISSETIRGFGGDNISNLWPHQNLKMLTDIFAIIDKFKEPYRKLFVFAFLQTVHLTSKMCAIRGEKANRLLSTSWGRPAYMSLNNYMAQNPLIQLNRSLYGNSGLLNAIKSIVERNIRYSFSDDNSEVIFHDGVVTNLSSTDSLPFVADFIITDPPYGDIIQYGELSLIWNVWLAKAYPKFKVNLADEVVISKNIARSEYEKMMTAVFNNCYRALKNSGKMIFTFNSNNIDDWHSIQKIIKDAGFVIEDFYLQKNLRASEANVTSKTGIAISDYYIKLSKNINNESKLEIDLLESFIQEGVYSSE